MKKENEIPTIKCGICGKIGPPATPLWEMCKECYDLFNAARIPKVYTLGHPANQTYMYEEDRDAKEKWFAHLRKHGFVRKGRKWIKKMEAQKP